MHEFARMSTTGTKAAMGRVLLVCNDPSAIQQVAEGINDWRLRLKSARTPAWLFACCTGKNLKP